MRALGAETVFEIARSLDPQELQKLASMLSKQLNPKPVPKRTERNVPSVATLKRLILDTHRPIPINVPITGECAKSEQVRGDAMYKGLSIPPSSHLN